MKRSNKLTLSGDDPPKRKKHKLRPWKPSESTFQAALFDWCKYGQATYPELAFAYAIPNGAVAGPGRAAAVGWMKTQGMKRGVPDCVLPAIRLRQIDASTPISAPGMIWAGLYGELKSAEGVVNGEQQAWHDYLRAAGYLVQVWRTLADAQMLIKSYLELPRPAWVPDKMTVREFVRRLENATIEAEGQRSAKRRKHLVRASDLEKS